jgi:hypothetical protein
MGTALRSPSSTRRRPTGSTATWRRATRSTSGPVGVLRNTLINTVRNVPVTYDRIYIAALIKKAWNAFREVRNLSWRRGRSSPEVLPVPR